jgi:hypothetical protein
MNLQHQQPHGIRKHKKTAGYIPAENVPGGSVYTSLQYDVDSSLSLVEGQRLIRIRAHNPFSANVAVSPVIFAQ